MSERLSEDAKKISRRGFLGLSTLAGLVATTWAAGILPDRATTPTIKVPVQISGIIPNCPFLPTEPLDVQKRMIDNLRSWDATAARVFLDYKFENKLGKYQYQLLDQFAASSKMIPLTVDLFDAYHLLHAPIVQSPYLLPINNRDIFAQQYAVFTDPKIKEALIRRQRVVVEKLKDESGILAWCLANELNLRRPEHIALAASDGYTLQEVHTNLFEEMIKNVISIDPKRPILLGIDDPGLVDEQRLARIGANVINSIHVYPGSDHARMIDSYFKIENHYLPLFGQEVGYSKSRIIESGQAPTEPEYDEVCAEFFWDTYCKLYSNIVGFSPWRVSARGDTHQDGYEIIPQRTPRISETIRAIKTSITANLLASSEA